MCFLRCPLWVKLLQQKEQQNGFSPVWILRCIFKSPLRLQPFPHTWQRCNFTPAWLATCSVSAVLLLQCLPHTGQQFELSWALRCTSRLSADSKVPPHTAHMLSASFEWKQKGWFGNWWLEEFTSVNSVASMWMKDVWLCCVWSDAKLSAGSSASFTTALWEDRAKTGGGGSWRALASCVSWNSSVVVEVRVWGCSSGFVFSCLLSSQTKERGGSETSSAPPACSSSSWPAAQNSLSSSLMCRGSEFPHWMLMLSSFSKWGCSQAFSSSQT